MVKYWELLAEYDAETTTYTACAGGYAASPYTPKRNARLVGLRVVVSNEDATTLTEAVQFRLTCATFTPEAIEAMALGTGLHTAPASPAPIVDCIVDQAVSAGVPITIEARNLTSETPVGVEVYLFGLFQS